MVRNNMLVKTVVTSSPQRRNAERPDGPSPGGRAALETMSITSIGSQSANRRPVPLYHDQPEVEHPRCEPVALLLGTRRRYLRRRPWAWSTVVSLMMPARCRPSGPAVITHPQRRPANGTHAMPAGAGPREISWTDARARRFRVGGVHPIGAHALPRCTRPFFWCQFWCQLMIKNGRNWSNVVEMS